MIDTSKGFADDYIPTETVTHSHGEGGEHSHAGVASYVWLDFEQAAAQATSLAARLVRAFPDAADAIDERRDAVLAELAELDAVAKDAGPLPVMIAAHPRYQYFARAYGAYISAMDWEAGAAPSESDLAALTAEAAKTGAKLFIWEADPGEAARASVEALGLKSVVFPPLAARPASGDFVSQMRESLTALAAANG